MTAPASPSTTARVMAKSTHTLQPKDTPLPMATSVSMFGAPWRTLWKPLTKNFLLTSITAAASSSCTSPMATWLPSKKAGSGQSHIIWPMEKYISGARRHNETIRRRIRTGVSRSASASSFSDTAAFAAPLGEAP